MPGRKALGAAKWLSRSCNGIVRSTFDSSTKCFPGQKLRLMATVAETSSGSPRTATSPALNEDIPAPTWEQRPAIATLYDFPSMEPVEFLQYKHEHLLLPLRRDLLHRAVVWEGDNTRQGTASTKWRNEIRGSSKKIRPQKGTGRARLGDRKSPMLRGGGVAHGPHPKRDFASGLQRKVYDKALRTALSYRYRRGELIIVNDNIKVPKDASTHLLKSIIDTHEWGRRFGRTILVTEKRMEKLARCAEDLKKEAIAKDWKDVDVKDLLTTARVIIERTALQNLLREHSTDLKEKPRGV